jgi:hypothetical protein
MDTPVNMEVGMSTSDNYDRLHVSDALRRLCEGLHIAAQGVGALADALYRRPQPPLCDGEWLREFDQLEQQMAAEEAKEGGQP